MLTERHVHFSSPFYFFSDLSGPEIYGKQVSNGVGNWHTSPALRITKPWGYSSFAHEIASAPQSWAAKTGDLQYYNYITRGGHFAALEVPELFAEEMRKCFEKLWK